MTDKMKAIVEAARVLTAHIDRHWPEHGQVTNFHSKVLRAALAALDAEPEVVWTPMGGGIHAALSVSANGTYQLVVSPDEVHHDFRWRAVPVVDEPTGHSAELDLAKAAALRAARRRNA